MPVARNIYRENYEMFRTTVRSFLERECVPKQAAWDKPGRTDRDTWLKAGRESLLCAIHDMRIVLAFDAKMSGRSVEGPTPFFAEINAAYAKLAGLRIGPGFKQAVRERVGGAHGCAQMIELLNGLVTAAVQTIFSPPRDERARVSPEQSAAPMPRPASVDTCHAYRADGEVVAVMWPPQRRLAG